MTANNATANNADGHLAEVMPIAAIPEEMKLRPQWVVAGADKVPHDPKTFTRASVGDPSTWATFDQAAQVLNGRFRHVGFVFTDNDPFTGIDLDDKPERPATAEQKARHQQIIAACESYTERSASGRGFHIIVKGKVPASLHRDNVEVYSQGRFFIMTGQVVRPGPVVDCQPLLDSLREQMAPPSDDLGDAAPLGPPDIGDAEVLSRARARFPDRLEALWRGDWSSLGHPSQSEADHELGCILAQYAGSYEQWERLFRASGLGQRDKADRRGYLPRTFKKACRAVARSAAEEKTATEHGRQVALTLIKGMKDKVAEEASGLLVPWGAFAPKGSTLRLVKELLGAGSLSVMFGPPQAGKSFLALDIAFSVATGRPWLGRPTTQGPVVYAVGEGQSGMRNRRMALALSRLAQGDAEPPMAFIPAALDAPREVDKLVACLDQAAKLYGKPPSLLVIDTLFQYFGDGDENSAKDMRAFLAALRKLMEHHPALHVMVLHHSGKDEDRGMRGSSALLAAADTTIRLFWNDDRRAWRVDKQKDGPDDLAEGFKLVEVVVGRDDDGEDVVSCVVEKDSSGTSGLRFVSHTATLARVLKEMRPSGGGPTQVSWVVDRAEVYQRMYTTRTGVTRDTVRDGVTSSLDKLEKQACVLQDPKDPSKITVLLQILSAVLDESEPEKRGARRKS